MDKMEAAADKQLALYAERPANPGRRGRNAAAGDEFEYTGTSTSAWRKPSNIARSRWNYCRL